MLHLLEIRQDKTNHYEQHISGHTTNGGVARFFSMRSWQLLFFVVMQSQMLISVWGQESIGCFVQGECVDSLYVGETPAPFGPLQCLEYCTGIEGSNHFSYDPRNPVSINNHL